MKIWLIALLDTWCRWWLMRRLHAWPVRASEVLLLRAMVLTNATEQREVDNGVSGEYKRHLVYAQLIKEFPSTKRRHLALAIEQAMQLQRG